MPLSPTPARAAVLAAAVLLGACRPGGPPAAGGPAPLPGMLRCSPTRLAATDTLTLAMSVPHGRELSIETPAGDFFNLVLTEPLASDGPMLMPAETFRVRPAVRLPVGSLRGKPFVAGRDSLERVFAGPGAYRLRMAEVLNTDDGTPVATCVVRFR
jgi:hypothetical protein